MGEGVTWTIQVSKRLIEDFNRILLNLDKEGETSKGGLTNFMKVSAKDKVTTERKNDAITLLEDLYFVDCRKSGRTDLYKINKDGKDYIYALDDKYANPNFILHNALYKNIVHYRYAYDFIIENEYYAFDKLSFIENIVINSSRDYGTRIYDWKSGENVLNFFIKLEVVFDTGTGFEVSNLFKRKFDKKEFIKVIYAYFKNSDKSETKELCYFLLDNSNKFLTSENINIEHAYKLLLKLKKEDNIVEFEPGFGRPPIPAEHALITLIEG